MYFFLMLRADVQAANAVLDLIPNMLNSLADIFNKITDFPNILLNAFSNIFGAISFLYKLNCCN